MPIRIPVGVAEISRDYAEWLESMRISKAITFDLEEKKKAQAAQRTTRKTPRKGSLANSPTPSKRPKSKQ